ncbi:MAG TPA: GC-type dockerin domain-anchored protein, partial [Phycisphaerales bacterium]|nr:GC-type dockerin domain-anchored protein [Phycisphaerales bacterium]
RVNLDTTAATAANLNGGWTLTFPAWAGVAFEVAGIESWRGPDWPGFESPVPSPERYDCAWRWPMKFVDGGVGAPWTVSGDVPAATVAYGSDNVQPWRTRLVAGGAAGQSLTVRSTGSLGTLPFNSDGWATLCWPMVRCSSPGLSWRLGVEQAGGAAGAAVTVEQGRVRWPLPDGGTAELATNGGDVRWAVSLHLHRDGRAAVSAVNMTDWYQSLTGSAAFSSALPAWHTAGDAPPLGHVTMDGAFGAPGTLECDGLSVHRWLTLAMVDSYTSAPTTGLAPLYHCADSNNAGAYSCLEDAFSPGHFAAYAPIDGGPVWQFPFTTGRSGSTTYLWGRHVLPGMAAARGVRYVMFGGVVNDVSLCGTPEQAAWIQQMSPPVLQSLIGSLAERESAFTWVLPVIGQAPNFHNERSLECFRSIWDAAAGAHCTGENARRFTVALPGPVWMPDGVHYLYNSGRVAAYTARSLQQRPACGTMPCGVADMGRQGGAAGADGAMDNNDFIVFIDRFFLGSLLADVSGQGALINPDGRLDNNDFVVFIDLFFTDCMR